MEENKKYKGLNDLEVLESREKYGVNEIEKQKKESIFKKILHIFTEPMFLLLIIAASIYFILGEVSDGIIMLVFVLFISGIEFVQEEKTNKALEELNTLSSLNVKVHVSPLLFSRLVASSPVTVIIPLLTLTDIPFEEFALSVSVWLK